MSLLSEWISSEGFMPHGFCYQWKPGLLWLHAASDSLIALAYFLIPVALFYFVRRRRDIPFSWMFVCFGVFIAACGATHVMEVWTLWSPFYWLSGGVKVITALASVPTAIFLVQLMPTALSLPSTEEVKATNERLQRQTDILKESQERFRQMAENIREIFWMMNPETKETTYVSPAFEQICELPLDSIRSNAILYRKLIHPDDRHRVLASLEKLESTNRFDEEFRIVCPSGKVKWLGAIGFMAKDAKGKLLTYVGTVQEITSRKIMEVALRESEDRYRDLVEHSTDLICTHSLEGRLLSVNELPVKLLGYSLEEMLDKPMRDFLLPEARTQFDESLLRIQKEGFVKGWMVVLTKSGERRIWEYCNTLRTEGVTTPIVRGVAHDVTEQKRLERALRLSEEKFSKAFHASPVEIAITTLQDGRFLEVNETFERNTGFGRDEAIGRTSIELGLWDHPNEREAVMEEVRKQGRVRNREIRFRTKSGQRRVKRYSAEQMVTGGKQCLLAVCEDITERKGAEAALQKTEKQFSDILTHSPNLIFLKDVAGRYLLINKEYRKTFHFTREQIYGKTDFELFPREQAEVFRGSDLDVLRARVPMEFEEVAIHDDGPRTSIVQKFPLFDADGEIYAICGFVTDITDRKRAEERLRHLSGQLLRSQDEERRKIAQELHDSTGQDLVALATMLGQLRGSLPASRRRSDSLLSQCKVLADQCIREVRTLSYLLYQPVLDQTGLVDAVRDYVKGYTERSGIQVELKLSPSFGRMARDVELALYRVMQEALTNIHRHSGSRRAKIRIDCNSDLTLEISDLGRGISANARIGRDEPQFGFGVGIPSMQERVKLIGGRLEIDSTDHGTTVRVTIPVKGERT
jgi:PAS domain S-box-containing protein